MASIEELDRLPPEAFGAEMAPLFEGAPGFLGRLAEARPFGTDEALFARARAIAHAMPESEQRELVDAHPRLGAPPASVSPMSYVEQGFDRQTTDEHAEADRMRVAAELERLNEAYEARFGFRYCVFVAGRPRAALLPAFREALEADRATELSRALDAVIDIAQDRYRSVAPSAPVRAGGR
ncbi:MAG TPA: 2-oxo-4-hydroxy-4-carboxy-5-ureidoimidazoline decarboxylase [Candidatus Limnocylindrales bacterium]|jgi:2-oxo-4-hydroxy-4-carboxy-5-ureidoimidazoline decarboxylase